MELGNKTSNVMDQQAAQRGFPRCYQQFLQIAPVI